MRLRLAGMFAKASCSLTSLRTVGQHHAVRLQVSEQISDERVVVVLTWREGKTNRQAVTIDDSMDLGRQPSAASAHMTNATPFLAPAACW